MGWLDQVKELVLRRGGVLLGPPAAPVQRQALPVTVSTLDLPGPWPKMRSVDTPGGTATPIAFMNPFRTVLIISTNPTVTCFVGTTPLINGADGIQLSTGMPALILTEKLHGNLVKAAWWAFPIGMSRVTVHEA